MAAPLDRCGLRPRHHPPCGPVRQPDHQHRPALFRRSVGTVPSRFPCAPPAWTSPASTRPTPACPAERGGPVQPHGPSGNRHPPRCRWHGGGASQLFGFKVGDTVRIEFEPAALRAASSEDDPAHRPHALQARRPCPNSWPCSSTHREAIAGQPGCRGVAPDPTLDSPECLGTVSIWEGIGPGRLPPQRVCSAPSGRPRRLCLHPDPSRKPSAPLVVLISKSIHEGPLQEGTPRISVVHHRGGGPRCFPAGQRLVPLGVSRPMEPAGKRRGRNDRLLPVHPLDFPVPDSGHHHALHRRGAQERHPGTVADPSAGCPPHRVGQIPRGHHAGRPPCCPPWPATPSSMRWATHPATSMAAPYWPATSVCFCSAGRLSPPAWWLPREQTARSSPSSPQRSCAGALLRALRTRFLRPFRGGRPHHPVVGHGNPLPLHRNRAWSCSDVAWFVAYIALALALAQRHLQPRRS